MAYPCMSKSLILAVAPNGAQKTPADHPTLPITADEIGRTAAACQDAGASMIHTHVRDRGLRHLLDALAYRDAIAAIRRECGPDLVIQITTEAAGRYGTSVQMAIVRDLKPEACSASIREFAGKPEQERAAADFFAWTLRESIHVQYILYDMEDLHRFIYLHQRGVVPHARPCLLFVLGRYAKDQQSTPPDLLPFLAADLPFEVDWFICAFGRLEAACALTAAAFGGHCRIGFENNTLLADGQTAPDNTALIRQLASVAPVIGRPLASGKQTRDILGIHRG